MNTSGQTIAECHAGASRASLAEVMPDRVIADSGGSPALRVQFAGRTGQDEPFALLLFASAGMGASARQDGLPTTAFPTNSGGGSIEVLESSAPLLFTKKEFRADSGGAWAAPRRPRPGHRSPERDQRSAAGGPARRPGAAHPALGVNGGLAGDVARVADDSGAPLALKSVTALPAGGGLVDLFRRRRRYGPPAGRAPAAIAADLREGFITHEAAVRDYGENVVQAGD